MKIAIPRLLHILKVLLLLVSATYSIVSFAQGPHIPCNQLSWFTNIPSGKSASVSCDGTSSYLCTTYEDGPDIGIHVAYSQGKMSGDPTRYYRMQMFFIDLNGNTTNITSPNYPNQDPYHFLFNDVNYGTTIPQFYLPATTIATYGRGVYRMKTYPLTGPDLLGTLDVVVIPRIKRIWVEATPICENTYLQNGGDSKANYQFKIKTEPALDDIFHSKYHHYGSCFEVEGGYFDPSNTTPNMNPVNLTGFNGCNMNNLTWAGQSAYNPVKENYSIDGNSLNSFFNNTLYPMPLQIKIKFDDQVVSAPIEIVKPIIINTSKANLANSQNTSEPGPVFHDYDYVVNGKEVWTPTNNPIFWRNNPSATSTSTAPSYGTYRLQHNLIITPGSFLTIKDMNIEFGPNARVIVQATPGSNDYGGRLLLNNSVLMSYYGGGCTNIDSIMWQGITVQGNSSKTQLLQQQNAYGANCFQGYLQVENGSNIMNAYDAVKLWDGSIATGGGLVHAKNSSFTNNKRAVEFELYKGVSTLTSNLSFFEQCNFITNKTLPSPFFAFISAWGVKNVSIKGCYFADYAQDPNATNYGIYGDDASFVIDKFGPTSSLPTYFLGLRKAVHIREITGLAGLRVRNSTYTNNFYSVHSRGVKMPVIENNSMEVPAGNTLNANVSLGAFLETGTGYSVRNNTMVGTGGTLSAGTLAWNTGTDPNVIKENTFEDLHIGSFANFVNRGIINGEPTGLQYFCNSNSNNNYDIAALGNNAGIDGIRSAQGSTTLPTGNQFSSSFSGHVDLYNDANAGAFDYYYQTGQAPNAVLGSVNPVNSVNNADCEGQPGAPSAYPFGTPYIYSKLQHFLYDEDELLEASEFRRDSLYYWVNQWNSPYGKVMKVDMLMEDGNVSSALTEYDGIDGEYELAGEEAAEIAFGRSLLDLRIALGDQGKTLKDLNNDQVTVLEQIAESAKAWAKVRAQNWLSLYDGRMFENVILLPDGQPEMRKVNPNAMQTASQLFPNPVSEFLNVTYNNKTDQGALLQITDITGRKVVEAILEGQAGQMQIKVADLQPGVYLYKIVEGESVTLQGKFVKQ